MATGRRAKGSPMFDAKHWRARAEEARVTAEQITDTAGRAEMLEIADGFEDLARRAEARERGIRPM